MKIIKRLFISTFVLALGFVAISSWRMSPVFNFDYVASDQSYDQCRSIEGVEGLVGAEDITIDHASGLAYIGTDERRSYLTTGKNTEHNGALWVSDLNQSPAIPVQIETDYPDVFHPHGIALLKQDSKDFLFVVNHTTTTDHQIDVFELTGRTSAKLINSISFPELVSPNDLYPISTSKFYVTNDHGAPRQTIAEKLEDAWQLANADIVLYDNGEVRRIISDLALANGILVSEDEKTLFVAESTREKISRFTLDDGQWTRSASYSLEVMPDNLEWDENGNILTASHPQALQFLKHTFDASVTSPSIAHRIDPNTGATEVLYENDGLTLSGSSVAASYKNQLLIGSVFEPRYIHCTQDIGIASAN